MSPKAIPAAASGLSAQALQHIHDAQARQALLAIGDGDYERVVDMLQQGAPDATTRTSARPDAQQPGAEAQAVLALAHFQLQQYELAARYYDAAVVADPTHDQAASWRHMRDLAQGNAVARVDLNVPDLAYFDRAALLAPPLIAPGTLPSVLPPPRRPSLARRFYKLVGDLLGAVGTAAVELTTRVYGWAAGYRDAIWTNWYNRPQFLAILTLAYMRERLNAGNLGTSYPPGHLVGFQAQGQRPPEGVTHFRTADGSWNNLADPKEGAAGTRFLRNVALESIRPEVGEQLLTPNPREISLKLLARPVDEQGLAQMKEVPFLNLLAASWIQFMNHDWINHGEIYFHFPDVIEVPLPEDDVARTRYWQTKMFLGKSQRDPTRCDGVEVAAQSAINEVTHWWDGSQIYGSDQATQDLLRSHVGGKMRLNDDGTLPLDAKGVEETGFKRNWWVGLAMLHTLFVHEHNAICEELHAAYPDWDDNRLFNTARLINAAVMAKIHTVEWTPAILPNPALNAAMNANWMGLAENFFKRGHERKALDDIKIRNPELGGVVGNPIDKHGRGFGLTEEFVEVYRLHSLLPEELVLRRRDESVEPERVPFHKTRQSGSPRITQRHALADLFYSFGVQHPGQLVLNNFPRFMQELSIPGNPFFDMATVDIVRARERGVPRYNEFRRQLGLNPIRCFDDLTDVAEDVEKLKQVYGRNPADVEKLDLLVGTLAEGHRPKQFGFGETMFQIFILNATRRLQADRFYTDGFNAEVYTPTGLRWIDNADFKSVLLRHFPQLADTGLANVRNAFEPWDDGPVLDLLRHPLRAVDPELKGHDPAHGDAHPAFGIPAAWCLEQRREDTQMMQMLAAWVARVGVWIGLVRWFFRKWFWCGLAWFKAAVNKPLVIPVPQPGQPLITPVPMRHAVPGLPIDRIRVCPPEQIPADERSRVRSAFYALQVWLYRHYSPMQAGLPSISADPDHALGKAFTWLHRRVLGGPLLPAEFLARPDLGALAVRGPYACYTRQCADSAAAWEWDLMDLARYEHHPGLRRLGVKVRFERVSNQRTLRAVRIDCETGSFAPGEAGWELARELALCSVTTHLALVRHFNGVHLAGGSPLAIATRNRLPVEHPLLRLLWPYIYATQQSNDVVTRGQMLPGGDFETVYSFTFDGMCRLFEDSFATLDFGINDPEMDARSRGVLQQGFDTPTENNLALLFEVMHDHARDYLGLYYPHACPAAGGDGTAGLRDDAALCAWLDELNHLVPQGVGVTRENVTFELLARLLARCIYLVAVQHEIAGSFLWNYQLWPHRQPVRVYASGQRMPLDVYQRLVNADYNLNVHRRGLIGDFSYLALDGLGAASMQRFAQRLQALQQTLEAKPWAVWKLYPRVLKVNINA